MGAGEKAWPNNFFGRELTASMAGFMRQAARIR
jgi:hypothetical protein